MDSVLRPRDIQARIRSGESPETVAAAAQTSVDKIMGFATPVLAERAYMAEQALKASVRRRAGDGPVGQLGEAVGQRLATRDVDPESVDWDAWRREDGRWTLVADYPTGPGATRAQFVYDAAGRYVMAEDDEARWLVGERSGLGSSAETVQETPEPQAALGDDAIEVVTGQRPAPGPRTADDWMVTQATDRVPQPTRPEHVADPVPEPELEVEPEPDPEPEPETLFDAPLPANPSPQAPTVVETEQGSASTQDPDESAKPRRSGKSKRASVPSWDEIMFGSGKGE